MGLHVVRLPQGAFRSLACQSVATAESLKGVAWRLRAAAPGSFQLLGPTAGLESCVSGLFGKLGGPLPLQVGLQDCNEAALKGEQTNVALRAETLQNNTLAELSARIATAAAEKSCAVVVAGPSSSGKTTFAARRPTLKRFSPCSLDCRILTVVTW